MSYWEHTETEEERSKRILDSWERVEGQVNWAVLYNSTLYRRRMTKLQTLIAKAKVVLTAAPTYLAALAAAIPLLLTVWVPLLPEAAALRVAVIGAGAVAVIGATIATIRILTPALKTERGILPTAPPQPPTS